MKHFCSCSFGKDSLATVLLALEHNEPLDGVVFSEVMFSHEEGISGEDPEHIKWIKEVAIPRLYELGCPEVHILKDKEDYVSLFNHIPTRGKNVGKKQGFPLGGRCVINDRCKMRPIRQFFKKHKDAIFYLGIAIDEPKRLARLKEGKVSLLAKYGYTEQMAYELCEKYGLLSPIYQSVSRGGCWFCPNRKIQEFCKFRESYPYIWSKIMELDKEENRISKGFKYGETLSQVEAKMDAYDFMNNQPNLFDI